MFGYDPVRHILVLELLPGGETLREYLQRRRAFPVETAQQLGNLLGRFHRAREHTAAELHASMFPRALPWILYMAEQQPENFPALSAGNSELLSIVKRYAEFGPALNALKAEWRHDGLIHGDLKWDNCILHSGGESDGQTQWKLIDWEMADIGDTSWDAGTLLQSFLVHWILTLPGIEGGAVASPQFADLALEQMQPAVHAFWKTYVQAMEFDPATAQSQLRRCVRYGGARMIQSAFECLYYAPKVTPSAICLLQASLNVLTKPEEAREVLFGL
jgi:thiamine kinase-like enzyme